jgi:hypothetical protein
MNNKFGCVVAGSFEHGAHLMPTFDTTCAPFVDKFGYLSSITRL